MAHENPSRAITGWWICALLLTIAAPVALGKEPNVVRPESVGMSTERLARIAPVMQRYIDDQLTPGQLELLERSFKQGEGGHDPLGSVALR